MINSTPWVKHPNHRTPQQVFSNTQVEENPKHWFHFGCPVFVLDENMQHGSRPKGGKWKQRAKIGIYLGRSPHHSRNVALVLNIRTGRVSPQFHVRMDSNFDTVKNSTAQEQPEVKWMEAAHFKRTVEVKNKSEGAVSYTHLTLPTIA